MRRQPDLSRVVDPGNISDACDVLPAAPEPHVAVVGGLDEPAADAHVQAAQDHDSPGNGGEEDELERRKICLKSHAGSSIDQKTQMACQCHSIIMY